MPFRDQWIVIPRWDDDDKGEGFQHYKNREPVFIKNYRSLLSKDEYLLLSFHLRGILHSLWLEYAASNRQIRGNTLTLTRRLGQRVVTRDLKSLSDAGFIVFCASAPLAPCYPRLRSREREDPGLSLLVSRPPAPANGGQGQVLTYEEQAEAVKHALTLVPGYRDAAAEAMKGVNAS